MPNSDCPVCRTADIVCGKWTLLIVRDLAEGRSRFCELERSLGGHLPAHALAAPARARGGGHRAAPDVPRGPAARRVRADGEGPRAGADHRVDARLRHRVAGRRTAPAPRRPSRSSSPQLTLDSVRRGCCNPRAACARGQERALRAANRRAHAQPRAARLARRLRRGGRLAARRGGVRRAPRSRSSSIAHARPRSAPLYCYRPLTGRFIAAAHRRCSPACPPTPPPRRASRTLPDLPAYLRPARPPRARPDARAQADAALQAFLGRRVGATPPTSSSTPTRFASRLRRARGRPPTAAARCRSCSRPSRGS